MPNLTNELPQLNSAYWSFMLGGLVDIPLCLSFADLQTYPVAERACVLTCSGNPPEQANQTHWQGAALADLLADVNIDPTVRYAHIYAADGYTTCIEFADLTNALLAYQLDHQPLSVEQGFPVRLIVPGLYGYKLPKHTQHIILSHQPKAGYWEQRGWPLRGQLTTTAAFLTPHDQAVIAGPTTLRGIAFAGVNPLLRVEINVDDGPWMPVALDASSPNTLAHWSIEWQPPGSGLYRLQVRTVSTAPEAHAPHSLVVQVQPS